MLRLQIALRKSTNCGTIDVDQLGLNWDSRLHLAVLQIIEELKTFRSLLNQRELPSNPTAKKTESGTKRSWILFLKHKTSICAILSPKHTIQLTAGNLLFTFIMF